MVAVLPEGAPKNMRRALRTGVCAIELAILLALLLETPYASASQRGSVVEETVQAAAAGKAKNEQAHGPSERDANTKQAHEHRDHRGLGLPDLSLNGRQARPDAPATRSRLTGSAQAPVNFSGFQHGLSGEDDPHRSRGLHVLASRVVARSRSPEDAYRQPEPGDLEGDAPSDRNQAWSMALNSHLLRDRLWLYGEYAASRQRHSAWGPPPGPEHGQAYSLLVGYTGPQSMLGGHPMTWGATLERRQANRSFWTLAEEDAAGGQVVDQFSARLGWGRLDSRFRHTWGTEGRGSGGAGMHKESFDGRLGYSATSLGWLPGFGWLLGTPSYELSMKREQHARLKRLDTVADRHTETAGLTAGFNPGQWRWAVSHTQSVSYQRGQAAAHSENQLTRLDLSLPTVYGVQLRPELKRNVFRGHHNGTETTTLSAALKSSAALIPKSLDAKLNLAAKQRHGNGQALDCRSMGVASSLDWAVRPQRANRGAVTVFVNSRYDYAEHAACGDSGKGGYEAFAGLRIAWPDGK